MNYLSIDIGTTCCKCQLFSEKGEILKYLFTEYDFKVIDGINYVDVIAIEHHLHRMIKEISSEFEISSIAISSLGESFVLLDENDEILFYPMLYTDPRGEEETDEIKAAVGEERAFIITGVIPHSMYSLSKLLYIKKSYPKIFAQASKVMLICDYIGYLLTGKRVIDYALASRTGAFDIEKKEFSHEMLDAVGIDPGLFSMPMCAGSVVGKVKAEWGIDATLVLGSHDQVCAALGAGVLEVGDAVDGMGTVECITTLFDKKSDDVALGRHGYCCVPYAIDGIYCTYILNFSCGSTVNWIRQKIMHNYMGDEKDFFTYIEKTMSDKPSGILTLPYFGGASTPYQNNDAKGVIINLTTETSDSDLYRSIMEGMAMEMRFNAEVVKPYGIEIKKLVATGGGANSKKWVAIKSDIQNLPIKLLRSSEGGLCGCAMLQATAMGTAENLYAARDVFVQYADEFLPEYYDEYTEQYEKYKKIYKLIKELY